jgi:hypothetical protein
VSFKPVTLKIRIESQEEAENFLLGLIVAKSNNSSPLFQDLVDGTNSVLESAKSAQLEEAMEARRKAGMA